MSEGALALAADGHLMAADGPFAAAGIALWEQQVGRT